MCVSPPAFRMDDFRVVADAPIDRLDGVLLPRLAKRAGEVAPPPRLAGAESPTGRRSGTAGTSSNATRQPTSRLHLDALESGFRQPAICDHRDNGIIYA